MNKVTQQEFERDIKTLWADSLSTNTNLFLEDVLKLIVVVTANVTEIKNCSLWMAWNFTYLTPLT